MKKNKIKVKYGILAVKPDCVTKKKLDYENDVITFVGFDEEIDTRGFQALELEIADMFPSKSFILMFADKKAMNFYKTLYNEAHA